MKKIKFMFVALALLGACEKHEVVDQPDVDKGEVGEVIEGETSDYVLPDVLYASISGNENDGEGGQEVGQPQTRTYQENKKVLWQNGDAISFFAGNTHNARYVYSGEDGQASVELVKDTENPGLSGGSPLYLSQAVYPYNQNVTVVYEDGVDKINLTYPTTQIYGVDSFGKDANIMVAAGNNNTDDKLYFRNACGYLVIKLYGGTAIKNITLSSVSGLDKIAGSAVVVASNDEAPIVTMSETASSTVTLDCSNGGNGVKLGADAEHATTFWFCLPPVTFTGGIRITATDINNNTFIKQTSKTVKINRNEIQPMAALEFVANAPAATKLWYTRDSEDTTPVAFYDKQTNPFDAQISAHKWDDNLGKFVIEFSNPLTVIKKEAFRDTDIETITIPEGIVTIEEGAFRNTKLSEITVPGTVNTIGVDAFYDCGSIASVKFLPSPTRTPLGIGYTTFGTADHSPFYYTKLSQVDLNRELVCKDGKGRDYIADDWDEGMFAHTNYKDIESFSVVLGPQVETISNFMFNWLPIETLTIPGTVKRIGNNVFDGCSKLKSLTFEPSLSGEKLTMGYNDDSDDDGLFVDTKLATLDLNREIEYTLASITSAPEGMFGGLPTLTNITLGEQVKVMPKLMFAKAGVEELVIPGTINTIENDVFYGCTKLATVTFEPSLDGTPLTLGFDTDGEDENLFQDSTILTTLNLDREIVYTLTGVDTPSEGMFGGMPTLVNVTLGNQVKTLTKLMFAQSSIENLVIPGSVNTIENDVFFGCTKLATVEFKPSPTATELTIGYDTDGEAENLFQDNNSLTTLKLNRQLKYTLTNVDTPSEGLFGGMPTLTSVTLGDQVQTLSDFMFAGTGITSINLNKVTTVENSVFAGTGITSMTVPGYVNTIGNDVFNNCTSLSSVTFQPSPTATALTIGYNTDGYNESLFVDAPLTKVVVDRELNYTFLSASLDQPSEGLFGNKTTLTSITIGDQLKTVSNYMFANAGVPESYGQCKIKLNKVETIGNGAFRGTPITHLEIPQTVTSIGDFAFADCDKLCDLTVLGFEPLTIGFQPGSAEVGPFYQSPLKNITVWRDIVPTAAYAKACDEADEGIFANKHNSATDLYLEGDKITKIQPFMFSGLPITQVIIPGSVTEICNNAFNGCKVLSSVTFDKGTELLTVGYNSVEGDGLFYDSPLTEVALDREISYTFPSSSLDAASEGLFGDKKNLTKITLGDNVKTLSPYMFAKAGADKVNLNKVVTIGKAVFEGSAITKLQIPASVELVDDYAFADCANLSDIAIDSSDKALTIGFQPNIDQRGPFYQSPLSNINIDRNVVMTEKYASSCDEWDEGIFSNKHYDNSNLSTQVVIGTNVTTIPRYMFAAVRMQELHFHEGITYIGKGNAENAKVLDAIVFYNKTDKPTLEDGAFGYTSDLYGNTPPGKYQYYIFVPKDCRKYYETLGTYDYWYNHLGGILTDQTYGAHDPTNIYGHTERYTNRSWYQQMYN